MNTKGKINYFIIGLIFIVIGFAIVYINNTVNFYEKPEEVKPTEEMAFCDVPTDCIPLPSECHTKICINKQYEDKFTKVEICTELFDYQAAYNPEDCVCQINLCTNKNFGRTMEDLE